MISFFFFSLIGYKIYYGAYEVIGNPRDIDGIPIEKRNAPIIDLSSFVALQDWTNAANAFINSGNIKDIKKLTDAQITPILKESKGQDKIASNLRSLFNDLNIIIDSIVMCRGISLIEGKIFNNLNDRINSLENTFIKPLNPIINKIKNKTNDFIANESIKNGLVAVQWCIDSNFIQQGITLLYEVSITSIMISLRMEYKDEEMRELVSSCIKIASEKIEEISWSEKVQKRKEEAKKILQSELFNLISKKVESLQDYRNDIDHAGFRKKSNPRKPDDLKSKLISTHEEIKKLLLP